MLQLNNHQENDCDYIQCSVCAETVRQWVCREAAGGEGRGEGCTTLCKDLLLGLLHCHHMSISPIQMLRSALAEHLEDKVKQFKHFTSVSKQVKHLREEVKCLQQWLAEATNKEKSASPASSDTSPDVLKVSCDGLPFI